MTTATKTETETRYKVAFDHDNDPDFSWLEQDMYNPSKPGYEPIYRAKGEPLDGEWYRNPENHVALQMLVFKLDADGDDWEVCDSLGSIDFLADSNDWCTGTFYRVSDIPERCSYQRELFRESLDEVKARD